MANVKLICASVMVLTAVLVMLQLQTVSGHGMVHDPVARSTRWRYNKTAPKNYNDNQLFCGGFNVSVPAGARRVRNNKSLHFELIY